jgi:integrase
LRIRQTGTGSVIEAHPEFTEEAAHAPFEVISDEPHMIFPSSAGTWRDPNNVNKQWRQERDQVGAHGVTTHSFRKKATWGT